MPQFVALAMIGAGLYAGYRWAAKQIDAAKVKAAEAERLRAAKDGQPRDLGTLQWDEAAGAYRPVKR